MSEVAEEMMRDSLNALVRRDVELAKKFWRWTIGGSLCDQNLSDCWSKMRFERGVSAFELILVAKNLERIGIRRISPKT